MTLIKHEIKMNFKSLLIWSLSVGLMSFAFILMFPGLKDTMNEMTEAYANLGGFSEAFGLDKLNIGEIMGFYGTEIAMIFALGGALFAAIIGGSILSKEEGGHTAEFLYTMPWSRGKLLFQKIVAMVLIILLFNMICLGLSIGGFLIIGETIEYKELLLFHLAQIIMHIEIAGIAFGISAFQNKNNMGLGIGVSLSLYFLDMIARIIPDAEKLKYITPFYYSNGADIISGSTIDGTLLGIGIGVAILMVVVGFVKYCKKDLAS